MDALQRTSTILRPNEWRAASIAQLNAEKYLEQFFSKPESEDKKQERARALEAIAEKIDDNLVELDTTVKLQITRIWGPWWWRRILLRRGEKAAASRRATPTD